MLLALVVGVSMLAKDILNAGYVVFLADGKSWLAGWCDVFSDIALVSSVGLPGAEIVRHGFTFTTVMVVVAMSVGSLAGTIAGSRISRRVDRIR